MISPQKIRLSIEISQDAVEVYLLSKHDGIDVDLLQNEIFPHLNIVKRKIKDFESRLLDQNGLSSKTDIPVIDNG